jgi:hypothetical protein
VAAALTFTGVALVHALAKDPVEARLFTGEREPPP